MSLVVKNSVFEECRIPVNLCLSMLCEAFLRKT